jgi:hypothetical protein
MMWGYFDGWNWLWTAGMMLVFWGAPIAVAIWAVRALTGPRPGGDPAMATLRQRLAAGQTGQNVCVPIRNVIQGRT